MPERSRRHFIKETAVRAVHEGPVDKFLVERGDWMIERAGVQKYLAEKIQYTDKLAGEVKQGVRVLDVGAGKGHGMDDMDMVLPGSEIIGVDPHDHWSRPVKNRGEQLAHNMSYLDETNTAEQLRDIEDNSLDGATYFFVLHHISDQALSDVFAELNRVLKDDGYAFIAEDLVHSHEQTRASLTDRSYNLDVRQGRTENFKNEEEWKEVFEQAGFKIIEVNKESSGKVEHGFFVLQKNSGEV